MLSPLRRSCDGAQRRVFLWVEAPVRNAARSRAGLATHSCRTGRGPGGACARASGSDAWAQSQLLCQVLREHQASSGVSAGRRHSAAASAHGGGAGVAGAKPLRCAPAERAAVGRESSGPLFQPPAVAGGTSCVLGSLPECSCTGWRRGGGQRKATQPRRSAALTLAEARSLAPHLFYRRQVHRLRNGELSSQRRGARAALGKRGGSEALRKTVRLRNRSPRPSQRAGSRRGAARTLGPPSSVIGPPTRDGPRPAVPRAPTLPAGPPAGAP